MSSEWLAYIDESGNDGMNLGHQGVSDYYVLAAVVFRSSLLAQGETIFADTRRTHFNNAPEMKSEYVGNDDNRRLSVTASLARAPFALHLRITDKRELSGKGFQYPKSFVKYLLEDLISELLDRYQNPKVLCDHMKVSAFEEEVKQYFRRRHPPNLMRQWTFDFADSREYVCLQAADLIAGTGHRCCERSPDLPEQDQLLMLLGKHLSTGGFSRFPRQVHDGVVEDLGDAMLSYDPQLEMKAVSDAEAYVSGHMAATEPLETVLVECVRELLKNSSLERSRAWVPTRRLVAVAEEVLGEEVRPRRVRSFIGRLRDEGLLIASRRNPGGYKLPNRMADVIEFLNTQNEKIKPMMRRIQKARNAIYGLSGIDFLVEADCQNLLRLLPPVGTPADNI